MGIIFKTFTSKKNIEAVNKDVRMVGLKFHDGVCVWSGGVQIVRNHCDEISTHTLLSYIKNPIISLL